MKIIKESKLNEKKSLEDTIYDELLDLNVEVYLSNLYDGYRVEVETEEQKEKVKKIAEKHKLETKEMGHKGYTDIHVIIPDEEELKRREKEEKAKEKAKETPKKKLTEDYGWEVKRGKEWDLLKLMIDTFGTEEILDNLAQALSRDELGDNLAYICRMLDFDNEYMEDYNDEEEDEDEEDEDFEFDEDEYREILKRYSKKEEKIEENCKKRTPKKALTEDENFDEELKKIAKGYQEDLKEIGTDWDKMLAYVNEQLDYDFNINSRHQYNSAKLWVGLGGPNVCLDTEDGTINVYWGGRKYKEAIPYKINEVLDDVMREIYASEINESYNKDNSKKKINERLISIKIDDETLLDELMNRVYFWTKTQGIEYDLYEDMYRNKIDGGVFDNTELDIKEIVDNDYVNYCRIVRKEDDDYEDILEEYKNGYYETKDGKSIESVKEDYDGNLVFLIIK